MTDKTKIDITTPEGVLLLLQSMRDGMAQVVAKFGQGAPKLQAEQEFIMAGVDAAIADIVSLRDQVRAYGHEVERLQSVVRNKAVDGEEAVVNAELDDLRRQVRSRVSVDRYDAAIRAMTVFSERTQKLEVVVELERSAREAAARDAKDARQSLAAANIKLDEQRGHLERALNARDKAQDGCVELEEVKRSRGKLLERVEFLEGRMDATKGDVTALSLALEVSRHQLAAAGAVTDPKWDGEEVSSDHADWSESYEKVLTIRREHDTLKSLARSLLDVLADVHCPHGVGVRETLVAVLGPSKPNVVANRAAVKVGKVSLKVEEDMVGVLRRLDAIEEILNRPVVTMTAEEFAREVVERDLDKGEDGASGMRLKR